MLTKILESRRFGHWERGRALHVIDLENLVGMSRDRTSVRRAWLAYEEGVGIGEADRAVIAVCQRMVDALRELVPPNIPLRQCGPERNAADRMLKSLAREELESGHFDTVIIGSGDHAFVSTANQAKAHGSHVWLVSGRGRVAHTLAKRCSMRSGLQIPTRRGAVQGPPKVLR